MTSQRIPTASLVGLRALFPILLSITVGLTLPQASYGIAALPSETINFEHRCSEPGHAYGARWQSYGLFENNDQGLVLAKIMPGWGGDLRAGTGIGFAIEKMRLDIPAWANDKIGFAWRAVMPTGEHAETQPSWIYLHSKGAYPNDEPYQLSPQGQLEWSQFPNRENREKGPIDYRATKSMRIHRLSLPEHSDRLEISLFVVNARTNERLPFQGPALENLDGLLKLERPKREILGLLRTLNPMEEGGLFGWLRHGIRYAECADWRENAKIEFASRWNARGR